MIKVALILFLIFIGYIECKRELKFVQAIWNHGESAPAKLPYPHDENGEDKWPRGWGQLTHKAIGKLIENGQFFEKRYVGNFTSRKFKTEEIYVRSSSDDLALTSAQTVLNGFFPPFGEYIFKNGVWQNLLWNPFPVHADAPLEKDPLLNPTDFDCPLYSDLLKRDLDTYDSVIRQKYAVLFDFLGQITGYGHNITFEDLLRLNDLNKEVASQLTQPDWVKKTFSHYEYKTTLQIVTDLYYDRRERFFGSKRMYYLRGGYILGDWLKRARDVVNDEQKNPSKMVLYSTNDLTLLALSYALNITDTVAQPIPPASIIFMEIWANEDGEHEIELYYRANDVLTRVEIPNCEDGCTFKKLFELTNRNALFDERDLFRECALTFCDHGKPIWPIHRKPK